MKKNKNMLELILFGIFFFVGIIFVIVGIIWYHIASTREEAWIKSKAEIVYIGTSESKRIVEVDFEVDSKVYKTNLPEWNSNMRVGNEVTIYYNPNNPNEIMGSNHFIGYLIFIGIGSLFVVIGIIPLIAMIQKKRKRNRLIKVGKKVEATIDNVSFKANYSVNGRHPYILECSYIDPVSNIVYFFKSDSIWYPIGTLVEKRNITTVPVYMNVENPTQYYVDIEVFNQYIGN